MSLKETQKKDLSKKERKKINRTKRLIRRLEGPDCPTEKEDRRH